VEAKAFLWESKLALDLLLGRQVKRLAISKIMRVGNNKRENETIVETRHILV
jgi:hypothetical protein